MKETKSKMALRSWTHIKQLALASIYDIQFIKGQRWYP